MAKTKKAHKFKPIKVLTAWTLVFMAMQIAANAAFIVTQGYIGLNGINGDDTNAPVVVGNSFVALGYLAARALSAFMTLVWMWNATRNTLAVRPGLNISLIGSVGWWFVPFAFLYKPYQYVTQIWFTAKGRPADRGTPAERPLAMWWFTFLGGNIASRLSWNIDNWIVNVAAEALALFATLMFFNIVRTVGGNQKPHDSAADVF